METGEIMSDTLKARRTSIQTFFAGTDITSSLQKYFISLTYTDNEEDETDDLQIKLQDRDGIWLEHWLNSAIQAAAELEVEEIEKKYKVTAKCGVTIHSSAKDDSKSEGTLAYGSIVDVKSIEDGWAKIDYSDKTGNVKSEYLTPIYTSSNDTVATSGTSTSGFNGTWNIGDSVVVSGRPQYSSYGTGTPGANVTNYTGSITHLNLRDGVPYPIHVGSLGWFAESQVQGAGAANNGKSETGESTEDAAGKGLKIQAAIVRENWIGDGKNERLECGQFELDSVAADGPPATITIKGTSLPYSSTIRQTQKSKPWENCTLSDIAKEIAGNNGMTAMLLYSHNPFYNRIEQYRTSDISFLQKLCQDAGYSLKITNNIIVIFDQAAYESQVPIRTIRRGKAGGYSKYKLQTGKNSIYTSCHVCYVDPDGNLIEATAYTRDYEERSETSNNNEISEKDKKNQCLQIRQKVSNAEEAMALAEKKLRLHNKYEFSAVFDFPGDPTLLAGCTIELTDWGAFDGTYIIKQAKHSVGDSGYTTRVTLRRVLISAFDEHASAPNANVGKSIEELAQEVIRGYWGNGADRKQRLTKAGYDYNKVQARVNEILL